MLHNSGKSLLLVTPTDQPHIEVGLSAAYNQVGIVVRALGYEGRPPSADDIARQIGSDTAVLLVGDRRYAPSTVLPGPFLTSVAGRRVPSAWLPLKSERDTAAFADVIREVHTRKKAQRPDLALLAQWHPRYLHLTQRVSDLLTDTVNVFRWSSDVVIKEDMIQGLGAGLGLGMYFGHGRPIGWVGYYGLRAHHFEGFSGRPLGCMLSLCCRTASRRRTSLSYAEALPLMGVAAASFGAIRETRHTDNTRWAVRICHALQQGVDNLADLLLQSEPPNPEATQYYRIIGDPLAPLYSDQGATQRAQTVPVCA
jgi:Peptidase family C25